jgi:hypothetical protein
MSIEVSEPRRQRPEWHYTVAALIAVIVVFAGFAPTFYLNSYFERRDLDALRIVHGVVFSLWPLLLIAQVLLVKFRRPDLHRSLGLVGAVLAAAMVLLGTALAIRAGRLGFQTPGVPPPTIFLVVPIFDMALFTTLVAAAIALRGRREDHRRLMILATLSILPAAFGRLPIPGLTDPVSKAFTPAFALLAAIVAYEALSQRKLHRAWVWGGSLFVLSVPLRLALANTAAWRVFARWLLSS